MIFKKLVITFNKSYFSKSNAKKLEVSNFFNYIPIKKNCTIKDIQIENKDVVITYNDVSKVAFSKLLDYIDSNENYKKYVSINIAFYEKPTVKECEIKMEEIYVEKNDGEFSYENNIITI